MQNSRYLIGQKAPLTKISGSFPSFIDENLSLGLDIGVGSCGQALIQWDRTDDAPLGRISDFPRIDPALLGKFTGPIAFLGVRAFDVPEIQDKTGLKLKNPQRRQARLMRRTILRRSKRMHKVRMMLKHAGLLPNDYSLESSKWKKQHECATPLQWRVDALDRLLSAWEFSTVLLHLAKHRGFKSNRLSDLVSDSKGKEGGTLESTKANREHLQAYRTVGEMWLRDERFQDRKRNREGSYTATMLRDDLVLEIHLLFLRQHELGLAAAIPELEANFLKIFLHQEPMQDPIALLGNCPFVSGEKRGTQRAYSFELSRALQKLNTLHLALASGVRVLLSEHVEAAKGGYASFIGAFGRKSDITWADLRKIFNLNETIRFLDLPSIKRKKDADVLVVSTSDPERARKELEKESFATRASKNTAALGSHFFFKCLGENLWIDLTRGDPASLDNAAFCLSFYEALESRPPQMGVFDAMHEMGVDRRVIEAIRAQANAGSFPVNKFEGAVSLSATASRQLVPHLSRGLFYTDAAQAAGFQAHEQDFSLDTITNPVVQSVVREVVKQVAHLIDQAGSLPGTICIELARDMGKSIDERNEIKDALEKRTTQKNTHRTQFLAELERDRISEDDLERYELWLEQGGWCPYSGEKLPPPPAILGQEVEVDHILPRSRSHDNSYDNKVLVYAGANRDKKQSTPFEALGSQTDSEAWRLFVTRVNTLPIRKRKRQHLLNTDFAEKEADFIARNLQDTRYICRLVRAYLEDFYRLAGEEPGKAGSTRRIFVQPGGLTSIVRKAWGLHDLKKDIQGERLGDKHHAVDALVCAGLSEGQRQWITRYEQGQSIKKRVAYDAVEQLRQTYQLMETKGQSSKTPRGLPTPWGTHAEFRADVVRALDTMTVSRRERRHGRGAWHNDTFYREVITESGEKKYYKRTSLVDLVNGKLKANDFTLGDIKDIHLSANEWLKTAIEDWIYHGRPTAKDHLPRGHKPKQNGELAEIASPIINKVWVDQGSKSARTMPHGKVVGGDQVRVDVFALKGRNGDVKYYLVPVYAYHIRNDQPPKRAITAHKPELGWNVIDDSYEFRFSLWPNSLLFAQKKEEVVLGYYSGVDRSDGKISLNLLNDKTEGARVSVKQGCLAFKKYSIDRLGRIFEIKFEKRTWRGEVSI